MNSREAQVKRRQAEAKHSKTGQIGLEIRERGEVIGIADAIAWISGLPGVRKGELLRTQDGSQALAFQLDEQLIGAVLLDQAPELSAGHRVERSGERLSLFCSDELLGRVIDPLGRPLDDLPAISQGQAWPLEAPAPPILARAQVTRPLYTGNTIIDTLLPIGRGQRQLLIGDNGTGKSSLALDAVIHQQQFPAAGQKPVRCIYVMIGQRRAAVVETLELLRASGALAQTTLIVAEANALPGIQYLAPFAGCALAESWMHAGEDVLIVYDDLSLHAQAYRELALLLRLTPGREAYPGDIFYLHSRLLERATCLAPERGGGSITALPLVSTQQGELASYIPTNLISITDGQIYLNHKLFVGGMLPAIDISKSVSRIGGKAQDKLIAKATGHLRLDYLQFLELELFTRFGTRLEPAMAAKLARGQRLQAIFHQGRLATRPIALQLAWLKALNQGLLDQLSPAQIQSKLGELALLELPQLNAPEEDWDLLLKHWLSSAEQPGPNHEP